MKKEIAKLKGYYISDSGEVYDNKGNRLKKYINPCGYYYVIIEERYYTICFLVANAFNPTDKGICIRHIDGNKLNDNKDNLEWYYEGEVEIKSGIKINKEVVEYDFDGNIINKWDSVKECCKDTNFSYSYLNSICNGTKSITKDNRIFRYSDDKFVRPEIKIKKEKVKQPKEKRNKKIIVINPDGSIYKIFNNITECSNEMNITKNNLYQFLLYRSSFKKGQLYFIYETKYIKNKDRILDYIEEIKNQSKDFNKQRYNRIKQNKTKDIEKEDNNNNNKIEIIIEKEIEPLNSTEEIKPIEETIIEPIEIKQNPTEIKEEINNKSNKLNMIDKIKGFIKRLFKSNKETDNQLKLNFDEYYKNNFKKVYKKVYKFDLNGNLIKVYKSPKECYTENNIPRQTFYTCARRLTSYHKFIYSYDRNINIKRNINCRKEVLMFDRETKELIREFKSLNETMRELNITPLQLNRIISGQLETNYILKYKKD